MRGNANVTMLASALLLHGPDRLRTIREEMSIWLEQNEYRSIDQLRGSMSQVHVAEPAAFERAHYVRTVGTFFSLANPLAAQAASSHAVVPRVTATAATVGLDFHLDRARSGNTFDAHRLLHHALSAGKQQDLKERLMAGYFVDGEAVGERTVLTRLATEAGLDEPGIREVLESDAFAEEVRQDEQDARRLGITGVPFFVVDRTYGISGAQPPELIRSTLEQAWVDSHPLTMVPAGGDDASCTDESCIR